MRKLRRGSPVRRVRAGVPRARRHASILASVEKPAPLVDRTLLVTGGAGSASWRLAFDELYGIPADTGKFTDAGMTDHSCDGELGYSHRLIDDSIKRSRAGIRAAELPTRDSYPLAGTRGAVSRGRRLLRRRTTRSLLQP